jgi:hypothetical protein
VVHSIAFWLGFCCTLPGDPAITTLDVPPVSYAEDYHSAAGRLNPELHSYFKAAYQKATNSQAFNSLTQWFKDQCANAEPGISDDEDMQSRIHPSFFSADTVQAIQSFAFKSGRKIKINETPMGCLTPWHFIKSLSSRHSSRDCRIPNDGLRSQEILDVINNINFLFRRRLK